MPKSIRRDFVHKGLAVLALFCGCSESPDPPVSEKKPKPQPEVKIKVPESPTWRQHVAPLFARSCASCHQKGSVAPFPLTSYEEVKAFSTIALRAIESRSMPPVHMAFRDVCAAPLPWADDIRLRDEEIEIVRRWVKNKMPMGPDSSKPSSALPPAATGIPRVDQRFPMIDGIDVSGPEDVFKCMSFDLGLKETRYIEAAQFVPGNLSVLHHAIAYIDDTGQSKNFSPVYDCFSSANLTDPRVVVIWVPGSKPMVAPQGSGLIVRPGARLVINFHYHPDGVTKMDDKTEFQVQWAKERPAFRSEAIIVGNATNRSLGLLPGPNDRTAEPEFRIPANVAHHTEHMKKTMTSDIPLRVWRIFPHMHYVGSKVRVWFKQRSNANQCIIDIPKWDFDWQFAYMFDGNPDSFPKLYKGDEVHIECSFDNSVANPDLQKALRERGLPGPIDVYWGERSIDEMCSVLLGYLVPNTD